jgi:hypothetical protein
MNRASRVRAGGKLGELVDALAHAERAVADAIADPLLGRLLSAFLAIPAEDRAVLIGAIEREVQARRLSRGTEAMTGQVMHPNPHARLYLRSHATSVPRQLLEHDELMLAMLSAFRVTPILLDPDVHGNWLDATREALAHVDAATRGVIGQLLAEVMALVAAPEEGAAPGTSRD